MNDVSISAPALDGASLSVTNGVQPWGPVQWVRDNLALALAAAGGIAWAMGNKTIGATLLVTGGVLLVLEKTQPAAATTYNLSLPNLGHGVGIDYVPSDPSGRQLW